VVGVASVHEREHDRRGEDDQVSPKPVSAR
jgi:hypothetical protein